MDKKNTNFSLIELIVIISIMAVMVSLLAPALLNHVECVRMTKEMEQYGLEYVSHVGNSRDGYVCTAADANGKIHVIDLNCDVNSDNHVVVVGGLGDMETEIDGRVITIPEGYKFVQWATEGKSYIIEDENGVQTIVIIKFD